MFKSEEGFRKTVVILLIIIVCLLSYGLIRDIAQDMGRAAAYHKLYGTQP